MKTIIAATLFAFSTALLPAASPAIGQNAPKLGDLMPGVKLPATAGKVVLVDFWASWCVPCEASFGCMGRLHKTYASKGLTIIAISVDEEVANFKAFAAKQKPSFFITHDANHKVAEAFNPPGMPTSYLIDSKGKIRFIHKGFKGAATEAEYTKEIETLLAEK